MLCGRNDQMVEYLICALVERLRTNDAHVVVRMKTWGVGFGRQKTRPKALLKVRWWYENSLRFQQQHQLQLGERSAGCS